jgi:ketosteroid isomerase-like protein
MRRSARWSVVAGVVAAAFVTPGRSAAAQAPAAVASDRARLLRLEDDWANALVKRDRAYFRRQLADGFVYTEDARLTSRDQMLREIVTPEDTVTASHNDGMAVHLLAGTGVVTGILVIEGRTHGSTYTHRYRFTDTWVKQADGSWKILAAQDYLIPPRKP